MSFDTLGLAEPLLRAVNEQGYTTPAWELFPYARSALFAPRSEPAEYPDRDSNPGQGAAAALPSEGGRS